MLRPLLNDTVELQIVVQPIHTVNGTFLVSKAGIPVYILNLRAVCIRYYQLSIHKLLHNLNAVLCLVAISFHCT